MEIRARDINRELLLEFSGEMDHHGARNALKEVEMAIDAALPQTLILDFSGVTFMDTISGRSLSGTPACASWSSSLCAESTGLFAAGVAANGAGVSTGVPNC